MENSCKLYPTKIPINTGVYERTAYNHTFQFNQIVSCNKNLCNNMETNLLNRLQPTTIQPPRTKFYPTINNTIDNPFGIEDDVVELMRRKPVAKRIVSCYVRTPVDGADYNGDIMPISAFLSASSPQVEAMRNLTNPIQRKWNEDKLPVFTPCCVLRYDTGNRAYYPINYTCLLDFDIYQDDNPKINLDNLKQDLINLPQIYYCGLATNGIDLFCIVPILTPQRYSSHARALRSLFDKQGIIIRTYYQITHTRPLSSDPDGYFNDMAVEFTKLY